ncbi:MAG: hypothetical protein IPP38_12340 [Bacteroidetes bacterium]|nr:hypothetical protein [Bacteroidota bacterium]
MKPKLSPLVLLDFSILNSTFSFLPPKDGVDIKILFLAYPIDIDFAVINEKDILRVFVKTSINQGETKFDGYKIFAEGVAIFNLLNKEGLSKEDRSSLLQYSSVSIAINSLRAFIANLTANAPYGKFNLPSIDVNDLFKQKPMN